MDSSNNNNNYCTHLDIKDAFLFDFIYLSIYLSITRSKCMRVCTFFTYNVLMNVCVYHFVYFTFMLFFVSNFIWQQRSYTIVHFVNQMIGTRKKMYENDGKIVNIIYSCIKKKSVIEKVTCTHTLVVTE